MVPMIRNILGGFLFSGDDVYKHVRVLSGGERTRLAVARMLLRPSNTLLLDEPTNHLDLDSKEVLLDALVDYGGTLIFVSHDRYFVERLATKIIEIGNGTAVAFPGTYKEFLYHKAHAGQERGKAGRQQGGTGMEAEGESLQASGKRRRFEERRRSERPATLGCDADRRGEGSRSRRSNRTTTKRNASTPKRERNRRPRARARRGSRRSKPASPRPRRQSARSSSRCPRPAFTRIAPVPSRSSIATRA